MARFRDYVDHSGEFERSLAPPPATATVLFHSSSVPAAFSNCKERRGRRVSFLGIRVFRVGDRGESMAGYSSGKTKRKDLDEIYDEFSEFSLSSPARKIRRLDADLPPILEEEEAAVPLVFQQRPTEQIGSTSPQMDIVLQDASSVPVNEERALVLYKRMDPPLFVSPSSSNVSLTLSPDLFPGFKNEIFCRRNSNPITVGNKSKDDKREVAENSLAMVPWVPPIHGSSGPSNEVPGSIIGLQDSMEAEEAQDGAFMEVEEGVEQTANAAINSEIFQQRHQHCMTPHIPATTSTPIMGSW